MLCVCYLQQRHVKMKLYFKVLFLIFLSSFCSYKTNKRNCMIVPWKILVLSDYSLRKYCGCATALSVVCFDCFSCVTSFIFFPQSPDLFGELDAADWIATCSVFSLCFRLWPGHKNCMLFGTWLGRNNYFLTTAEAVGSEHFWELWCE